MPFWRVLITTDKISANRKNVPINNLTKHYEKIMETDKYPYPEDIEVLQDTLEELKYVLK